MNGNDRNYPEAGNTGAYAAPAPGADAASSTSAYGAPAYGTSYDAQPGSAQPGAQAAPGPDAYPPYGYGAVPPPVPPSPGSPNPGLAALLGFIPGVGAMYNGQFAKGIAHIVIFSVLTSLSNHGGEPLGIIFGFVSIGWYFYMVFDAYQTARARREGLVPPDPFGLNTIGERFGMPGNGPNWGDFVARPATGTGAAGNSNPYAGPVANPVADGPVYDPTAPFGAPQAYTTPYPGTAPQDVAAAYRDTYTYPGAPYATGYPAGTVPPPPYTSPYANAFTPGAPYPAAAPVAPTSTGSGLPTGALWLIGFGVLALIGSLAHNFYWSGHLLVTFGLLVLGIVLLVTRVLAARSMYPADTAAFRWNLLHTSRIGFSVTIAGVLQMLDELHVAYWDHTWPYLLIAVGLFQVLDRALYNRMLAEGPIQPFGVPPSPYGDPYSMPHQPVAPAPGTDAPLSTAQQSSSTPSEGEVR